MSDLILTWSWEPDPIEYPKVEPTLNVFYEEIFTRCLEIFNIKKFILK